MIDAALPTMPAQRISGVVRGAQQRQPTEPEGMAAPPPQLPRTRSQREAIVELMNLCIGVEQKLSEYHQKRQDLIDALFNCIFVGHQKRYPEMNDLEVKLLINQKLENPEILLVCLNNYAV